jgi:hypothetical protein
MRPSSGHRIKEHPPPLQLIILHLHKEKAARVVRGVREDPEEDYTYSPREWRINSISRMIKKIRLPLLRQK